MHLTTEVYEGMPADSLLRALTPDELENLLEYAHQRHVKKGKVLFEKGDPGDSMVLVLSGTLKASAWSVGDREVVFDYVGAGGIVGELAVLDGQPRAAQVAAVEDSEIIVIQRRFFLPFLECHWLVATKVIEALCQKIRQSSVLLEDNAGVAMGPKLARGLLRLAEEGVNGDCNKVNLRFPINQGDLANYVSLSRENVNRQLREWEDNGFVELGRGHIAILNSGALAEIGEPSA